MGIDEVLFFGSFIVLIFLILLVDLGVFSKKEEEVSFKKALMMTGMWIFFALLFYLFIRYEGHWIHGISDMESLQAVAHKFHDNVTYDHLPYEEAVSLYREQMSLEYLTGYLIEYALSIDNIFVIMLIFNSFAVPRAFYRRVLMWGILGALVMRFIFIFLSSALIQQFSWVLYIFGVFLVYTGVKIFLDRNKPEQTNPQDNFAVKFLSKYFSITDSIKGHKFFERIDKKVFLTPLFVCLVVIEISDVIFALDSIPAIFSITRDPFVVFFSNIFAILGLRSLFFVMSNIMNMFRFLRVGLAFLLVFIGAKILAHHWLEAIGFDTIHSLFVVLGIILLSIIFSILIPEKKKTA